MTELVSDQLLADIEARCDAATAGPWVSVVEGRDQTSGDTFIDNGGEGIYLTGASLADHDFIAHARQDIPLLVAEVRRLRSRLGL